MGEFGPIQKAKILRKNLPNQHGKAPYLHHRKEAAEYLRISPKSLKNHPNHIPFHEIGRRVLPYGPTMVYSAKTGMEANNEPGGNEKVLRFGQVECALPPPSSLPSLSPVLSFFI
jgi:hypothetical protein